MFHTLLICYLHRTEYRQGVQVEKVGVLLKLWRELLNIGGSITISDKVLC